MKERRTNFFMVDNRIFEYDLKPRDIAVYCFLCRRLNQESNVAFPSRKDIGKGCGIKKEETVDKALKVLVEKGLIEKYHRHTNAGDYGSNVYRLKLESDDFISIYQKRRKNYEKTNSNFISDTDANINTCFLRWKL